LNHEQGHYDITEIFARKMRQELSIKKYRRKNVQVKIEAIMNKYIEKKNECQDKYDIETNHSLNTDSQKKWTEYIRSQLIDLLKYSNPNVTIRLK
jgi:predicted secreted Zn-dependent protease